jgi:sodium-coupled monocarboxylate transporter 8/12
MYARYADCDPFTTGAVKKNDQLLPYFIMDVASHIPGLSGLFIAGIFCAALSTLSAFLNCVAGTLYEDFVLKVTGPIDDDKRAAYILKFLVCIVGVLCTLLVFIVLGCSIWVHYRNVVFKLDHIDDSVLQSSRNTRGRG